MRVWITGFILLLMLVGCGEKPKATPAVKFTASDITGADFGKDFQLTDHNGKVRNLADFKGKVVVLFFGYTHCPDVCPTTLSDFAMAIKRLGEAGEKVQVLFVTVDPARDTPTLLAQYVPSFNPAFLGLYGSEEATAKVAKDFHVFYEKHGGADGKNYSVDHTAGTYIFDRQGRLRLFMSYGQDVASIVHDLKILLTS